MSIPRSHESVSLGEFKKYEFYVPKHLSDRISTENHIVDCVNKNFHEAIENAKRQDVISVSCEGKDIGRHGKLEWLCISTSSSTYLFDIETLGKTAFEDGLKSVLENRWITKVFHDCRRASDSLFHQYNTKLANVYDTQVAEFVLNAQINEAGNIDNQVVSLNHCLTNLLQIPKQYIYQCTPQSLEESRLRPLNDFLRSLFIKNVIYLRLLKQELDIVLREPFRRCIDIYLQTIQRRTDQELRLQPIEINSIPSEMLLENMQLFQITEQLAKSSGIVSRLDTQKADPHSSYDRHCRKYKNEESDVDSKAGTEFQNDTYQSLNQENLNTIADISDRNEITRFLLNKMFVCNENNISKQPLETSSEFDSCSLPNLSPCPSVISWASKCKMLTSLKDARDKPLKNSNDGMNNDFSSKSNVSQNYSTCDKYKRLIKQNTPPKETVQPFENSSVSDNCSSSSRDVANFNSASGKFIESQKPQKPIAEKQKSQNFLCKNLLSIDKSSIFPVSSKNTIPSNVDSEEVSGLLPHDYKILLQRRNLYIKKQSSQSDCSFNDANKVLPSSKSLSEPSEASGKNKLAPEQKHLSNIANPSINISQEDDKSPKRSKVMNSSPAQTANLPSVDKDNMLQQRNLVRDDYRDTVKRQTGNKLHHGSWSTDSEETNCDGENDSSREEGDPWSRLRSAFAEIGSTNNADKLVFVPAGMQC